MKEKMDVSKKGIYEKIMIKRRKNERVKTSHRKR